MLKTIFGRIYAQKNFLQNYKLNDFYHFEKLIFYNNDLKKSAKIGVLNWPKNIGSKYH